MIRNAQEEATAAQQDHAVAGRCRERKEESAPAEAPVKSPTTWPDYSSVRKTSRPPTNKVHIKSLSPIPSAHQTKQARGGEEKKSSVLC
jgi:hypothetical protein